MEASTRPPWTNPNVGSDDPTRQEIVVDWVSILRESYARRIGKPLDPALEALSPSEAARGVYNGRYVVLSHDKEMKYNFASIEGQKLV